MNIHDIKWGRNVATAAICAATILYSNPGKWMFSFVVAAGFFLFGCIVDLAIAKLIASRKPRRIMSFKCNVCQHEDRAMSFYFVWYPGCEGPEPEVNPCLKCPKCSSTDLEEKA